MNRQASIVSPDAHAGIRDQDAQRQKRMVNALEDFSIQRLRT